MKYTVTRPFSSSVPHAKGDVVELDGPHVQKLVDQRYLAPYVEPEAPKAPVKAAATKPAATPAPAAETTPKTAEEPVKAPEAPKKKRGRPPKVRPVEVTLQ